MRKIEFTDSRNYGEGTTEIIEVKDNTSDSEIQELYEQWVFERIGDYFGWQEVE